jgi:hypothetical protein
MPRPPLWFDQPKETAYLTAKSLQPPRVIDKITRFKICTALCDRVYRRALLFQPCKPSGIINQSIVHSIEPSAPQALHPQSHTDASPKVVTGGQHSLRAVLSITARTALYRSARWHWLRSPLCFQACGNDDYRS